MSMEPLNPEEERLIRDSAARLDRYPTFGMAASVNMLRLFATLDMERRQKEQANALLAGAVSLGAERARERNAMRESCALLCLGLIDDTEREHMARTIPGFDLGSGLAKVVCAETIRKGKP